MWWIVFVKLFDPGPRVESSSQELQKIFLHNDNWGTASQPLYESLRIRIPHCLLSMLPVESWVDHDVVPSLRKIEVKNSMRGPCHGQEICVVCMYHYFAMLYGLYFSACLTVKSRDLYNSTVRLDTLTWSQGLSCCNQAAVTIQLSSSH